MALKGNTRKTYKTMRGKVVDMDQLQQRNELTPAVGNARVNARGDELGPGGKIVRKKEQAIKDYYKSEPAVKAEPKETSPLESKPKEGVKSNTTTRAEKKVKATEPSTRELEELEDDWVEDDDGNFVPKGE